MALSRASRKAAGAALTLIGLMVWVAAAVAPIVAFPEVAFLGVPLGGMLTRGGLALTFASGRRIAAQYFEETEEVAGAARRPRPHAESPSPRRRPGKAGALRVALLGKAEPVMPP
jgi:hypothetical protein